MKKRKEKCKIWQSQEKCKKKKINKIVKSALHTNIRKKSKLKINMKDAK